MMVTCHNVNKSFIGRHGIIKAVVGVSFEIKKGEAMGFVGESASGKTTLGKIILGIVKPDSGEIRMNTKRPQVIFQDPYNSLDPKMKVMEIIGEGLVVGKRYGASPKMIRQRIEEVADLVRLDKIAHKKYPHEFSGGERQRIAIARAVVTEPEFIVCDEPVSSLDMTIQLDILNLLKDIKQKFSMTYLFISHDLRAVKFICDRVAVMKEGRIVEEGPTS
ncbi:MAG: dipeptide/oligopeptide/nickel ABC transporter ATP-binding protein, partial [Candidatus Omnitrophica bacterium]|nr:dipeptide/oligopeptide/nickel ABC transporter ATP-binding protein [Candidatus Omnitrophota bacterium]